jgi:hypothetical protein
MIFPTLPDTYIPKFTKGDVIEPIKDESTPYFGIIYEIIDEDFLRNSCDSRYFLKVRNSLKLGKILPSSWYNCKSMDERYQLTLDSKLKKLINTL